MIRRACTRVPEVPIFLGGATGDNICELMRHFDGVSVAIWAKNGDMKNSVDAARAKRFIDEIRRARELRV